MTFVLAAAAAFHLIGWPAGPGTDRELRWEQIFASIPSAANTAAIEQRLSSVPHRAGTPADYATARFMQQRLQADGFQTRIVPYDVMFTAPVRQQLDLVAPRTVHFDLLEGTPGHHTVQERAAGPPFLLQSGDGDVSGPLYYVNRGSAGDLQTLDALGVDLRGAIVVIRGGGGDYYGLTKRGVVGMLSFSDPADDGYGRGETWPRGNYKNIDMAERTGGLVTSSPSHAPGDPTTPGQAPVPGVKHLPWTSIPHSTIPELPITQRTARTLLAGMTGAVVPPEWHPLFEFVQHTGGNVRVHVAVQMSRHLVRIWNVFGDLRGSDDPSSIVMIGSHRDAMAFGAIDPGSGTTVLLQDADGFHALAQQGWKPKRTIEVASWDGHELGLFGSISYAYQFGDEARQTVIQYINTDQVTTGDPFLVRASPELYAFMKQIADVVPGPSGSMLGARDASKTPLLNPASTGSDQQTFAYMLGIPSTSNGFRGAFGAHHTAEDNIPGIKTYDPGYKEAVSDAVLTGIQAMRAAGAAVQPFRLADHARALVDVLAANTPSIFPGVNVSQLRDALDAYVRAGASSDAALDRAELAADVSAMQALSDKQHSALAAFYVAEGLNGNRYLHTLDFGPFGFPDVFFAHDAPAQQTGVDRLTAAVQAAAAALR